MRGPIDYIIVGFEGDNFKGEILKELEKVTSNGTVAVLALAVVSRDQEGNVTSVSLADTELSSIAAEQDLITEEDIQEVGELLEDNTSAGLLIIEQLWAKGLKAAIIGSGGVLIDEGRIHPEAIKELDAKGDK